MLDEGMRNASTRNARMTRKIAIAPASDLNCSQPRRMAPPPERGAFPARAAATTFFFAPSARGGRFFGATAMKRVRKTGGGGVAGGAGGAAGSGRARGRAAVRRAPSKIVRAPGLRQVLVDDLGHVEHRDAVLLEER